MVQKKKYHIGGRVTLNMSQAKLQGNVANLVFTVHVKQTSEPKEFPVGSSVKFVLKGHLKTDRQIISSFCRGRKISAQKLSVINGLNVSVDFIMIHLDRNMLSVPVPRVVKIK